MSMSFEGIQSEQRRHQYLTAMGVTSWLPRAALVGAHPSPESIYTFLYCHEEEGCESEDAPEIPEAQIINKGHRHTVAPVTASSLDLLVTSDKSIKSRREVVIPSDSAQRVSAEASSAQLGATKVDAVESPAAQEARHDEAAMPHVEIKPRFGKEKAPRFRLGFWLYKDVLVIDTLPLLSRGGITQRKYQTLCANMVKAMGLEAELLAAPYVLAWPMLAGDSLDQGKAEASLAVNHKIHKLLQEATPCLLLFLGESAAQMSMQRDEGIDELRAVVFNYSSQMKAITTLSLTQMLQIPECKKEVWADLQKVLPVNV